MSEEERNPDSHEHGRSQADLAAASDTDLVRYARLRNPQAWSEFERRHRSRIYALTYSLLRDREEALDATQESLIRFYGALEKLDAARNPAPFLMQVALNVARDRLRVLKRRQRQVSRDDPYYDEEGAEGSLGARLASTEPGPAERTLRRGMQDAIVRCVEQLSPRDQTALWGRYYGDLKLKELAPLLGVTPRGAKHVVEQAVARLAALLANQGIELETLREGWDEAD